MSWVLCPSLETSYPAFVLALQVIDIRRKSCILNISFQVHTSCVVVFTYRLVVHLLRH